MDPRLRTNVLENAGVLGFKASIRMKFKQKKNSAKLSLCRNIKYNNILKLLLVFNKIYSRMFQDRFYNVSSLTDNSIKIIFHGASLTIQ